MRVDGRIRFEYATCDREIFVRKELADSKLGRYSVDRTLVTEKIAD